MLPQNKGLFLVFLTGLISGLSIFVNKFAVSSFNPFQFTFLKNAVVAVFLLSVIVFLAKKDSFAKLSQRHWKQLGIIGLAGGSAAFLLYFYALKLTSAVNAGFLHKTLFVFAAILGVFWLKEKPGKTFLFGGFLLLLGNLLVFSKMGNFSFADLLIVLAVILWAVENAYAKKVLQELSGLQVAFGRMFFGSIFILAFLLFTNQAPQLGLVSVEQLVWIGLTSALLFGYVATFYSGLKTVPVSVATAVLLIGQPVTAALSVVFSNQALQPLEAVGLALLVAGTGLAAYSLLSKKKNFQSFATANV